MNPVYDENRVTIYEGDVRAVLSGLPAHSVHCCVTSPPYWGLRDYGTASWHGGDLDCDHVVSHATKREFIGGATGKSLRSCTSWTERDATPTAGDCSKCGARRIDAQIGLEATPNEYIATMVAVFREVRRVLRGDGTLWLNMGDSYMRGGRGGGAEECKQRTNVGSLDAAPNQRANGYKAKDLVGMPWMLALALRADGWYLRSDIIWSKPNPMPESVTDRPTKAHEYIFLLTKSERYFYDADAIRERVTGNAHERGDGVNPKAKREGQHSRIREDRDPRHLQYGPKSKQNESFSAAVNDLVTERNKRSVWEVATQAFPEAHFATFPEELIRPCILAGTSEKGCCVQCGAPWVRIVEKTPATMNRAVRDAKRGVGREKGNDLQRWAVPKPEQIAAYDYQNETIGESRTIGWEPGCECAGGEFPTDDGPESLPAHNVTTPCTVIDPFFGSGTTALVARVNGCRAIGIEFNPAYIEIARRRLRQSVLPF